MEIIGGLFYGITSKVIFMVIRTKIYKYKDQNLQFESHTKDYTYEKVI